MLVSVNDFLSAFSEIEKLYAQNRCFKIGTSIKLLEYYKKYSETYVYILERIKEAVPGLCDSSRKLDGDEKKAYELILESCIDVEKTGITEDELSDTDNVYIGLQSLEKLRCLM